MIRLAISLIATILGLMLILPLLLLSLPFVWIGLGTRYLPKLFQKTPLPWEALIEFDPEFGWKPKGNLSGHHLADDVFQTTTDGDGWRGSHSVAQSQLLVFGDSFAWGYGISDRHFFSELLPGLKVKSIGASGYNMVQEFLWMERYREHLKGKLVVWLVYLGNDLWENLSPEMSGYRMPFVREKEGSWEIVRHHIRPERWPNQRTGNGSIYYQRLAELCGPSFLSSRAYSACHYLIGRANDLCLDSQARLAVLSIPDQTQLTREGWESLLKQGGDRKVFDPDYPDRELSRICEAHSVPFVAGKKHFDATDFKRYDCHWNVKGHRRTAEIIQELHDRFAPSNLADFPKQEGFLKNVRRGPKQAISPIQAATIAEE